MIPKYPFEDLNRVAIYSNGKSYTYADLVKASSSLAAGLLKNKKDLDETRIALMVSPSFEYVPVQWGIWKAGGIAVPLCLTHPLVELEYVIDNADCHAIICEDSFREKLLPIARKKKLELIAVNEIVNGKSEPVNLKFLPSRAAMILYTSGTTSKPKGVVITHGNIKAQVNGMIEAWGWVKNDRVLSVLPLHHVHGIINVVTTALYAGACVDFLPKFDAKKVWEKFIHTDLTVFMAVPTIYYKLIEFWEKAGEEDRKIMSEACRKMRLMICGSAALPVSILQKWKTISGHTLLERYGMTEIGMALSNPLNEERKPGYVGMPMPGVEVKLVNENFEEVTEGDVGEILVKGQNVFREYWKEPEITIKSFVDGWFKTGDMAMVHDGYYKIIGRSSVDIIKSGGYKISALEIEEVLREHPAIKECAVIGLPDEQWGEVVAAALICNSEKSVSLEKMNDWLKDKLAPYKMPREMKVVDDLPKNALGKVVKMEVKKMFADSK